MAADFYEEDEPLGDVEAAFARGRKVYLDGNGDQIRGTSAT
jgi:hypothetical protein